MCVKVTMHIFSGDISLGGLKKVVAESYTYDDLVIFDFQDSYSNLTIKTLSSFHFVVQHFRARYILKVDDDMFINVKKIQSFISNKTFGNMGSIMGDCPKNSPVVRTENSKYFVSKDNYSPHYYPQFCYGTAYIITWKAAELLLKYNKNVTLVPLEDVSLGILSTKVVNITITNVPNWRSHGFKKQWCPKSYTQHRLLPHQIQYLFHFCSE